MNKDNLIYKAQQKDKDAIKQLYLSWAKYVYAICLRYSKDEMQAEDYLQDSFMKIFDKLNMYNSEKGAFKNWISRVTVNTILMDKRKEKKRKDINTNLDESEMNNIGFQDESISIFEDDINEGELLTALRSMPSKYKDVLNLFIFDEWNHAQIANALNITESNSRSRLTRAKKMLKQILIQKMIYS